MEVATGVGIEIETNQVTVKWGLGGDRKPTDDQK
jgi:hypothetical protein